MNSPRLRYLPLGGLGEVGINMWALEWENKVLVVDAGLMFPQEDMLGIDLVLPDISHLLQRDREVLGIFLTHGHEDHIGGLPFALRKLNVPVYGTRLTLGLVKPKLREHRILRESDLREVRVGDSVQLGPFRVETVAVCHSIPDAVALAIDTPVGRVVYTSDFKLDPAPPDGHPTDMERFRRLGDDGVLLLLSDSTNAEREGRSGSERDLHGPFERIFSQAPGRIVAANFASNLHRMQRLVRMAAQFERKVAILRRTLQHNFRTARESSTPRSATCTSPATPSVRSSATCSRRCGRSSSSLYTASTASSCSIRSSRERQASNRSGSQWSRTARPSSLTPAR